jgi:hypothetical protein
MSRVDPSFGIDCMMFGITSVRSVLLNTFLRSQSHKVYGQALEMQS